MGDREEKGGGERQREIGREIERERRKHKTGKNERETHALLKGQCVIFSKSNHRFIGSNGLRI